MITEIMAQRIQLKGSTVKNIKINPIRKLVRVLLNFARFAASQDKNPNKTRFKLRSLLSIEKGITTRKCITLYYS
jgi:hypothetical protein